MSLSYAAPESVDEALAALRERAQAEVVAGGTDLVVGVRNGKRELPGGLVSIHRLDELRDLRRAEDGSLQVGALVNHLVLESSPVVAGDWPALSDGAALIGSRATRNLGTLGGNLVNASPAMDTGAPLLVLGATVTARSADGERTLELGALWAGPGRSTLARDELLTSVHVDAQPDRSGSAYVRLEYRRAMEIAVVGAAARVTLGADDRLADVRLALSAVAPTCVRVPEAEELLDGVEPSDEAVHAAAERAASAARPIDDVRGSADYRRAQVVTIARRALRAAIRRARGERVAVPATRTAIEET
jgi:aerobic carbon-monoxide dehydrogenase medium subunit